MGAGEDEVRVALQRPAFGEREREAVAAKGLTASLFRYDTGVDAIRLSNARGNVVILPYMGQMVWSAAFDAVPLEMRSMFPAPRPAETSLRPMASSPIMPDCCATASPPPATITLCTARRPARTWMRPGSPAGRMRGAPGWR